MRKSTTRTQNYRAGGSRGVVTLATFRDQMADYARAERLRELRKTRHLSREKVAAEIGVSTKTVFAWENGGGIRWPNAKKLGTFYGVDAETLVSRDLSEGDAEYSENGTPDQLERIEQKLDRVLAILSTEQFDEVLTQIEREQERDKAAAAAASKRTRAAGRR